MTPLIGGHACINHRRATRAGLPLVFAAALAFPAIGCGSGGSTSAGDTTTVPETTTTTAMVTTTGAPGTVKPTCAEVDAWLAQLPASDRALLSKSPMLMVRHGPSGGDTWQILSFTDVTGQLDPQLTVTYDWSPSTGLSDPVMVAFGDDSFLNDPNAQTVLMMQCMALGQ